MFFNEHALFFQVSTRILKIRAHGSSINLNGEKASTRLLERAKFQWTSLFRRTRMANDWEIFVHENSSNDKTRNKRKKKNGDGVDDKRER